MRLSGTEPENFQYLEIHMKEALLAQCIYVAGAACRHTPVQVFWLRMQ